MLYHFCSRICWFLCTNCFYRLIGVDQIHIGTVVGKMEGSKKEVYSTEIEIEKQFVHKNQHILEQKWYNIKPVFAVASGGLYPSLMPSLIKILGKNIICQFGGGCHGHPLGTRFGAIAINQALKATLKKIPLRKYAKSHLELDIALKHWS
jgi:ribulose-bisphosphate carboxylase large chain